nr:hypothetical protein [Paraburkholderia sacchari]
MTSFGRTARWLGAGIIALSAAAHADTSLLNVSYDVTQAAHFADGGTFDQIVADRK